jgi:hypothetical protein
MGYRGGDKVFYVSATNWQGEEALVDAYEEGWDQHLKVVNDEFEVFFKGDPNFSKFLGHMFHVWDENHCLQVWMPYIIGYTLMM